MSTSVPPKRVLFFLPSLRGGGAEHVLVSVANGLVHRGHHVEMCVAEDEGACKPLLSEQVTLVPLRRRRVVHCLFPLARHIRKMQPDAIITTMMHANITTTAATYLARSKARLILREASAARELSEHNRLVNELFRLLAKFCYARASTVLCVSKGAKDAIIRKLDLRDAGNLEVLYSPLAEQFTTRAGLQEHTTPGERSNDGIRILAMGRLEYIKGFDILIKAVAKVQKSHNVCLEILGEGSQRPALESLAHQLAIKDFHLPGYTSDPSTSMFACDVFVLSSRSEGFPNVLLQAMASGARIVATNCKFGPEEILENGRWGTLVPVDDASAMARAITSQIDKPDHQLPGTQVFEQYSSSVILSRYEQLVA